MEHLNHTPQGEIVNQTESSETQKKLQEQRDRDFKLASQLNAAISSQPDRVKNIKKSGKLLEMSGPEKGLQDEALRPAA